MQKREFTITKMLHWHSIGCTAGGTIPKGRLHYVSMVPTVENVRGIISQLFPDCRIDERYMTVKEQIAESLDCGFFSIDLYTPEIDSAVETYSISFDEVI